MRERSKERRRPPARLGVLREAWADPLLAALPPNFVRTRREARLARTPAGVFDHVARIDRTLRKVHLQRLCQWFVAGAFRIEDARELRDLLLRFEAAKARLPAGERDFNRFRTPGDLEEALDRADGIVAADPLGPDTLPPEVLAECAVVAAAADWHVIRLDGPVAATHFADGTRWCTRHPSTFQGYRRQGPVYMLRHRKRRLQMHPATGQLMDERDRRADAKALDLFPAAARDALLGLLVPDGKSPGIPSSALWIAATLLGLPDPGRGQRKGLPVGEGPSRAILVWQEDCDERGGLRYGLLAAGKGARLDPGWRPDPAQIAAYLGDRPTPAEILLDLGPGTPGWHAQLSAPDTAHAALLLCGDLKGRSPHEAPAVARIAEAGILPQVLLHDPVPFLKRLLDGPARWSREHLDLLRGAIPGVGDPFWERVCGEPAARASDFDLVTLLRKPIPDEGVVAALIAYAGRSAVLDRLARHLEWAKGTDPVDFLVETRATGHPGIGGVLAGLLARPAFADRLMAEILPDLARMVETFRALSGDGREPGALATLLAPLGIALSQRYGRLPDEADAAVTARAILSGPGILLPRGGLRDRLESLCHPDFREAFAAVSADPAGRLIRRRPGLSATPAAVARLLAVPHTGHLVAAVDPALRRPLAERAIDLGRGGILACLPGDLATPDLYARLTASPDFTDLLDLDSVGEGHLGAAAACPPAYRERIAAARFANGDGPDWIAAAARVREASDAPPAPYVDPAAAVRRVTAGSGLRAGLAGPIASGALPATQAEAAVRLALAEAPWLALDEPGIAHLLPPIDPAAVVQHPGLAPRLDPAAIGTEDALRLCAYLPREALARIGTALPGGGGPCPWADVVARIAAGPGMGASEARRLLEGLPLDPGRAGDRAAAARLIARAGTVRPRGPRGDSWPLRAFLLGVGRGFVGSGFRLDRFLPGASA